MADYDSQTFFLARAVQKNNAVMPVPFCPKATPAAYVPPKQNAWLKQGLIGAVIGGIVGGIGVAFAAYCFVMSCTSCSLGDGSIYGDMSKFLSGKSMGVRTFRADSPRPALKRLK